MQMQEQFSDIAPNPNFYKSPSLNTLQELKDLIDMLLPNKSVKGIFLLDNSPLAAGLMLEMIKMVNNPENRKQYYKLFLPAIMNRYISGVIVSMEILEMKDDDKPLIELIPEKVIIGTRIDTGIVPLSRTSKHEYITEGLDGLEERIKKYKEMGVRFVEWRSVYKVTDKTPSCHCLNENGSSIGRFAAIAQRSGIVPFIRAELLSDGLFDLKQSSRALEKLLATVVRSLGDHGVYLEMTVIHTNMVQGGNSCEATYTAQEIADATLTCLRKVLPTGIGGVVFLSGGMSEEEATTNLNAITYYKLRDKTIIWPISYAYGRAMQASALKMWGGNSNNIREAQNKFKRRQLDNAKAGRGFLKPPVISTTVGKQKLYIVNFVF